MSRLAALVDPAAVTESLDRAGLRPASAGPLVLEQGWALPRIPFMLRFRDPAAETADGLPAWWAVHGLLSGRPPYVYRQALKTGSATLLEDLGAVAQRFPDDLLLGDLRAAADPSRASEELVSRLTWKSGSLDSGPLGSEAKVVESEVVGYKPTRRCLVRYRLASGTEHSREETFFGKCFPPEVDVEQWEVHQALDRLCCRQMVEHLSFARPGGRVSTWNMLWWRRHPGTAIYDLLGTAEGLAAMSLAGRSLAELHASDTNWPGVHDAERERSTLGMWVRAASVAFPSQAAGLRRAEAAVLEASGADREGEPVPSHRDFYDKQVLVHGDKAVLLDLETACRAEAELDVANFLAHLRLRSLQRPELDIVEAGGRFLEGYRRSSGSPSTGRLAVYLGSAFLRLACVYAFRPTWGELSDSLVEEAVLTAGQPVGLTA